MSERERKVLEQLEQEFNPSPSSPAGLRWSSISASKRLRAAAGALPAGMLFVILGLVLNSIGGIILPVVGYLLIVGSVSIFVDCSSSARAALIRGAKSRTASQPPRYLR